MKCVHKYVPVPAKEKVFYKGLSSGQAFVFRYEYEKNPFEISVWIKTQYGAASLKDGSTFSTDSRFLQLNDVLLVDGEFSYTVLT